MSPRLGALIRTVLLILLFAWSAFDDSMPPWWWVALIVVLMWTMADFIRWTHDGAERTGDDD